jgi:hypothetical protein
MSRSALPETRLLTGVLTNAGTIVQATTDGGSSGYWGQVQSSGGTLNNLATGVFDLQSRSMQGVAGTNVIDNAGTFRKSTGTNQADVAVSFNNTPGGIEVRAGTLNLAGACNSSGGKYFVASGSVSFCTGGLLTGEDVWIRPGRST